MGGLLILLSVLPPIYGSTIAIIIIIIITIATIIVIDCSMIFMVTTAIIKMITIVAAWLDSAKDRYLSNFPPSALRKVNLG